MSTVLVSEPVPGVRVLTLNRPDRLNALDSQLVGDLVAALDQVAADGGCRVVVLTGAGRGFCAGLDLAGFGPVPEAEGCGRVGSAFALQQHLAALVPRLRALHQPVIAAVNGAASGGGFALALAADIRVAATSARFNVAFVKLGLSGCDIGVSWLLPRLIGASRAWELMLTGRVIDSGEADAIGLLTRVVPDEDLLDHALDVAGQIVANAPWGVRMTKEVAWSQLEVGSLQAGIDLENRTQVLSTLTGNLEEAAAAFLERRQPIFGPA